LGPNPRELTGDGEMISAFKILTKEHTILKKE